MIEWLSQYSGLIVLVGFSALFTGIAFWTFAPRNKDALARHAHIPFKEAEE
jgi:cbb3-type cytochrome oxidase subunit 3